METLTEHSCGLPDHHWWDYPEIWKLPKRPEDGQLDWERLFPHQRDVIRRFSATLRTLSGLPERCTGAYQPFGTPEPTGLGDAYQFRYAQ